MAGAFDDLVPGNSAGAFDDLVPKKNAGDVQRAMMLRQVTGGLPIAGPMSPDVAFGAMEPLMKVAQMLAHIGGNDTGPAKTVDAGVNAAKGAYEKAAQPDVFPAQGSRAASGRRQRWPPRRSRPLPGVVGGLARRRWPMGQSQARPSLPTATRLASGPTPASKP
jgi:hypothetical protein